MQPNKDLFSGKAANYSKFRPAYPRELIHLLEKHISLTPLTVVADIGSGTGIMSRLFIENGNVVYAVEPNDEMRQYSSTSLRAYPQFHALNGTGENTGIADNIVDLVVCAQSFHWLNPELAKKEFHRILNNEGYVALVWNDKVDSEIGFNSEYEAICKNFKKFTPNYSRKGSTVADPMILEKFFSGDYRFLELENYQELNIEGVLGRYSSTSYAIDPEDPRYTALLNTMEEAFERHQEKGFVRLQYKTKIFLGKV